MVMESPSPQSVGREFVRQYYTMLNQAPLYLHRFYSHNSSFIHGGIDPPGKETKPVMGQQDIHRKIMQLNFRDCHTKIRQFDSHATISSGVVVQVTGELSNNGQPMRRFMQTFVLAPQSPKKYYVHNDIFRYQDEVFSDEEDDGHASPESEQEEEEVEDLSLQDVGSAQPVQDPTISMYYEEQPVSNGTHDEEAVDVSTPPRVVSTSPAVSQAPDTTSVMNPPAVGSPPQPIKEQDDEQSEEMFVNEEDSENDDRSKDDSGGGPVFDVKLDSKMDEAATSSVSAMQSSQPEHKTYANIVGTGGTGSVVVPVGLSQVNSSFKTSPPQQLPTVSNNMSQFAPVNVTKAEPSKEFGQSNASTGNNAPVNAQRTPRPRGQMPSSRGSRDSRPNINFASRERDESVGDSDKRRSGSTIMHPDSHQLFVGNLPHNINEEELKHHFSNWGNVVDVRINSKQSSKPGANNTKAPPNFGFIVFDLEESVKNVLDDKPIFYQNEHRLNVEVKKKKPRGSAFLFSGPPMDDNRPGGPMDGRPPGGRPIGNRPMRGGMRMNNNMGNMRGGRGGFVNLRR